MAVFKCKMCGGDLNIVEGMTVCECEYCGSKQTVPTADNEKKMTLFSRANRLRLNNEFDKASGVYESIVSEFPEEAEAYWGLVLCRYGIEYVDDPATGKKIPTCHRSSFDSVMDDSDFEQAQENADPIARRVYREEAKRIEEIRKGILEVSGKEEPYDIFICYKETADDGQRTLDSVLAQDVYDMLTENGYRVFFSRVSLEDKLGVEYEPYIFAALNSAKIMLAFGTDYDYYNAVWVKNEWSRFLQLIARGEKKVLIPCYKNIDAYDMPKEFAKLQAQDLSKVGANQDLLRGIKKLLPKEEKTEDVAIQPVAQILKRAFMFLEDGEWKRADEYCERVLDQNPENAEAYIGKLMAELHVRRQQNLANCKIPFDKNNNYQKAIRFGSNEVKKTLVGYVDHINERNINREKDEIYKKAVSLMQEDTADSYQSAAEIFQTISGFMDADDLYKKCLAKHKECIVKYEESLSEAKKKYEESLSEAKKKSVSIVAALRAGAELFQERTREERLADSEEKIENLTNLLNRFEVLQAEASRLQTERTNTECEYIKLTRQREELISYESSLYTKRARLGMFAAKEKKHIQEELSTITVEKQQLSEKISVLASRKKEIADQIIQTSRNQTGYKSVTEITQDLAIEQKKVSDLENAFVAYNDLEYSYDEAVNCYLSDPEVARAVNNIFPQAAIYLYLQEKVNELHFGRYVLRKNTDPRPIEWIILEKNENRLLLISKYALDCQRYHEEGVNVTWETCTLRTWLNDKFINDAFNSDEQKLIESTTIMAEKNPEYDTSPGKNTEDKVFLLSVSEVKRYFSKDIKADCFGTAYCCDQIPPKYRMGPNVEWWLRSPGCNSLLAASVLNDGSVHSRGRYVNYGNYAVRPAIWVNLDN